jgi:hypothetical protein
MVRAIIIGKSILIVLSLLLIYPAFLSANPFQISQFISPETCGECHSDIFNQWQNSMHSLAQKDPVYLSVSTYIRKGLTDQNEIAEAESCVKCHVPVGVVTGYPKKVSDDKKKIPAIANHGIQCDYCHSATSATKMYNNGLQLSPGNGEEDPGIKRGPFKDSESDYHETAFSKFHTGSEICGTCHNVKHVAYMTDLETTYEEWEKGPYNHKDPDKRITCQGCHMYQRPGLPATGSTKRPKNKGVAADDGPERAHIFTHYFIGGNRFVPGLFDDKTKQKMADERLKHAASLSIDTGRIKDGKLEIVITNTGAGHYLPTGLTDTRQMWLEIEIRDEQQKKILYSSGKLDKNRYLQVGGVIYHTVFGDGKGNRVLNIAKAKEIISDKRIPPLKSVTETIPLPSGEWTKLFVQVKLLYRSAPQKIVDTVAGKGKLILPVVTMASVERYVKR